MSSALIAVLSGDLVGSTKLDGRDVEAAFERLSATAEEIGGWAKERGARFERFRGDGWQMLLHGPAGCLRAALLMRAAAIGAGVDTRVSIGVGTAGRLSDAGLGASDGPAFQASGRGLEALGGARLGLSWDQAPPLSGAVVRLIDAVVSDWTARQAEIANLALRPDRLAQREIAEMLLMRQPTVSKHVRAAKLAELEAVLSEAETVFRAPFDSLKGL